MSQTAPFPRPFRVVIVGGGPNGLCLAHALTRAGIDYVLLERRDTVLQKSGLGLALWPHGVRILDQIGLFEEALGIRMLLKDKYNYLPDGTEICHSDLYDSIEKNHGHAWTLFKRQELLELLHRRLPENDTRILPNKHVVAIETLPDGVRVRCEDGSEVEGSIVVGCDGVHSRVRRLMRELALASSAQLGNAEKPMMAGYQMMAGHLGRIPHMTPNRIWEVRRNQANMQIFMLENDGWFLVYRKLPEPAYEYRKYTDEEAEAFGNEFADYAVTKDLSFGELWRQRKWVALFNIEEGFLKTWHWDRIVLLGDAVHKMTPNSGLGLNCGWQGIAALSNGLSRLLATNPNPDLPALTKVFQEYQKATSPLAKQSLMLSQMYIRVTAWDSLMWKIADRLGPYLGGDKTLFRMLAAPIVKNGMILDELPEPNFREGVIPWKNRPYIGDKAKDSSS